MRKCSAALLKGFALIAVLCFGIAHSAQADSTYSLTQTVYYVGPTTDPSCDNPLPPPGGVCRVGGNPISSFNGGITSAGSVESISFDAVTSADVNTTAAVSITGGDVTIELYGYGDETAGYGYGPGPSGIVNSSGQLVAGTYTFAACNATGDGNSGDYFGINDDNQGTQSANGCDGSTITCLANTDGASGDQLCLGGAVPADDVTINVSDTGVVTIAAGSFEVGFSETPELPSLALFGTGLLAMGIFFRKSGFVV